MKKRKYITIFLAPIIIVALFIGFCFLYWTLRAFFDPLGVLRISDEYRKLPSERLISKLHNIDPISAYPRIAMEVLAERKEVSAVPELIKFTRSWNPDLRCQAIRALGNIGDVRATDSLVRVLHERRSNLDYHGALLSLAQLRYEPVRPIILDMLKKEDGARNGATTLIGYMGRAEDLPILESMLAEIKGTDVNARLDRSGIMKAIEAIKLRE